MSVAYLSLGSNLGDRLRLIQEAVAALTVEAGPVTAVSAVYETEPWGVSSPHRFLNVALALDTIHSPRELLDVSRRIEQNWVVPARVPTAVMPTAPSTSNCL